MNTVKEGSSKSKTSKAKASNTFDKALAAMIKTLNACHFDQGLHEQTLYCEPLMNQMPNFKLKLCFGYHYGSAIEGALHDSTCVIVISLRGEIAIQAVTFFSGIIGSNYRFEACFASLNSDFQASLQVRVLIFDLDHCGC
jgi:hypothetical protein